MSESNGKPAPDPMASITILTNLRTGGQTIDAPKDTLMALKLMGMAQNALLDKLLKERAQESAPKVETASASAVERVTGLKILPRE